MRFLLLILCIMTLAAVLGTGASVMILNRSAPFDTMRDGPWEAWPRAGSEDADPYTRAFLARDGTMALGTGEGLVFLAREDDQGKPLRGDCTYRIEGRSAAARLWTLAAYTQTFEPITVGSAVKALSSQTVVRREDGSYTIEASARARPWNWLPVRTGAPFVLVISLYDTPLVSGLSLGPRRLPSLRRGDCL